MVKIIRLTRHPLQGGQLDALREVARQLLGDDNIVVVQHEGTIGATDEVLALVRQHGASLVEAVLPLGLLAGVVPALQGRNIPVVRAIMARTVENGEALFRFEGYELIEAVDVRTRRIV